MISAENQREREALIERPRLAAAVDEALRSGPLLVVAGPGFGKTTLLEQALREPARRLAWVACTDAERDQGRLLLGLVGAIRRAVPGAADAVAERLAEARGRIDASATMDRLLADLARLLVEPLFIVIDDAEHLEGADAVGLLDKLLMAHGAVVRVAIASRRALDLRAVVSFAEIDPADLAFSAEESAALLQRRRGEQPPERELAAVYTATEGWPLGVALFAASSRREAAWSTGRVADDSGADPRAQLHAYLAEEVLGSLDDDARRAALKSSVSNQVTPRVADALELPADLSGSLGAPGC